MLIFLLFVVGIPNLLIALVGIGPSFSNLTSYILAVIFSFTIYPFIKGYVAENAAEWWKKEPEQKG